MRRCVRACGNASAMGNVECVCGGEGDGVVWGGGSA